MALEVVGSNPTAHPKISHGYPGGSVNGAAMGCSQEVRHGTLTPAFAGSNPATPATFLRMLNREASTARG